MALIISFGKTHLPMDFGTAVPMVEYGLRKYGEAWYENGILTAKNSHPTVEKLFDWIDEYSPRYIGCQDVMLERLTLEELEFVYQLMCDFREDGTSIDGVPYDTPLNEGQKRQLDAVIPVTKLYLEARRNGAGVQRGFSV